MTRRKLLTVTGLFALAALVAVAIYVDSVRAGQPAVPQKGGVADTPTSQIKQLEAKIALLEARIAALEKRPVPIAFSAAPGVIPNPAEVQPPTDKDGFPPVRYLLLQGQAETPQPVR